MTARRFRESGKMCFDGDPPCCVVSVWGEASMTVVRGVELVEQVIAFVVDAGERVPKRLRPLGLPMGEPALARASLAGGRPLPPSLRRWLGFDASIICPFDDPRAAAPRPRPLGFRQLLAQEFRGYASGSSWQAFEDRLPGDCYLLPGGSDARRFLYVGEPDGIGEYPVLCVDTHDVPFVCVYSPGFDVWLAETYRQLPGYGRRTYTDLFDHPDYAGAMAEQARKNFGGFRALDETGADTAHLDGQTWMEATGVGSRAGAIASAFDLGDERTVTPVDDDEEEETRPGDNPFTGRPGGRRRRF
jgi:hypothetical protein